LVSVSEKSEEVSGKLGLQQKLTQPHVRTAANDRQLQSSDKHGRHDVKIVFIDVHEEPLLLNRKLGSYIKDDTTFFTI